jgi:mRNA interferase RelE/StbE
MSKTWRVQLSPDADKTFRKLPSDLRRRVLAKLHDLEDDPRPRGHRKLVGYEDLYRLRVGSWRITYSVLDDEVVIIVLEITSRGDAYRNL